MHFYGPQASLGIYRQRQGVLNQAKFRNNTVVLTKLGHGVFGNETSWVVKARNRAIERCPFPLDVLQYHYSRREPDFDY
jgi:hypothetical protein